MKKYIFALFCLTQIEACGCDSSGLHANQSEDEVAAISHEQLNADELVNQAFVLMSEFNDNNALEKADEVLKTASNPDALYKAYMIKSVIYARLDNAEKFQESFNNFKKFCPYYPRTVETDTHIYIYNAPNSDSFRKRVTSAYIYSNISEKSKIKWIDNIGIIEKNEGINLLCKKCSFEQQDLDNCLYWCYKLFITSQAICGVTFGKNPWCLTVCLATVEVIRDTLCNVCCEKGGWATTCSKHFKDIFEKMGESECIY